MFHCSISVLYGFGLRRNQKLSRKVFFSHTPKSKNRANRALRLAAFSLAQAKCALGAFYRRIREKYGAPLANIATAHKLARIIYKMLKDKVEYVDLGEDYYNEKFKSRLIHNLKQKSRSLGFLLVPTTPSSVFEHEFLGRLLSLCFLFHF